MAELRPDEAPALGPLRTLHDLVESTLDYGGGFVDGGNKRYARRAVLDAYRLVSNARDWAYFRTFGTFSTVASYSTGTIAYDHTGGAAERLLTLTTGTWPDWAAFGTVLIDNVPYDVATRESSTTLTLSVNSNPGADIASGTTYQIYREAYPLPADFKAMKTFLNLTTQRRPSYIPPEAWLSRSRIQQTPAEPIQWTITGAPKYHGLHAIRFRPPPNAVNRFDYCYVRRARPLQVDLYEEGTVACTDGGTTITGTGTTWKASMVGSVIRFAASANAELTGFMGESPPVMERTITKFTSATSVEVGAVDQTLSGVKYAISDPVDVDPGNMLTYLLRECEKQMRVLCRVDAKGEEQEAYERAMVSAFETDGRQYGDPGWHGAGRITGMDVRDYPEAPTPVTDYWVQFP